MKETTMKMKMKKLKRKYYNYLNNSNSYNSYNLYKDIHSKIFIFILKFINHHNNHKANNFIIHSSKKIQKKF